MKGFFLTEPLWLFGILMAVGTKSLLFGFDTTRSSWAWIACLLLFGIYIEVRMLRKAAHRKPGESE